MPLPSGGVRLAIKLLGIQEATPWLRLAEQVDAVERRYIAKVKKAMRDALAEDVWAVAQGVEPKGPPLERVFEALWFKVMAEELAETRKAVKAQRLAKRRAGQAPRSLKELQTMYDAWRKGLWRPKNAAAQGKKVKDDYLKAVRQWWTRRADDFIQGRVFSQEEVVKAARREVRRPMAQARTVVRTETTGYQNQVRREVFDSLGGITHYLFLSIRDRRTTKWCQTRHGMVMEKGTKLLEENTPAVHWNCRSEIVPLDPDNPRHLQMINDSTRRASNRHLEPLPKDFRRT